MAVPSLPTFHMLADTANVKSLAACAFALAVASKVQHHAGLVVAVAGDEQQAYRLEAELRFYLAGGGNGTAAPLPVVHLQDTEALHFDPFSPHQEMLFGGSPHCTACRIRHAAR